MAQSKIHFFFLDVAISIKKKKALGEFIEFIFNKEKTSFSEINCVFASDSHLLSLNSQFLKRDYFTDIITFDLSKKGDKVYGEIYISVDRVKENAKKLAIPVKQELHRVIFHGVLHLCGYKDKTK